MPIIATAAWSISKAVTAHFPSAGSGLARYAARFPGVEVNTTFYRRHRPDTFVRWAADVPEDFRFAIKMPKTISHEHRLKGIEAELDLFLADIAGLGKKLGPLLCQLPPNLRFDADVAEAAFAAMRARHSGPIVLEPRHPSWAGAEAGALMRRHGIDPVLADPPVIWKAVDFTLPPRYIRLHGTPKIYYSAYDDAEIDAFIRLLPPNGWCVFDNTASGAATSNALTALSRLPAASREA